MEWVKQASEVGFPVFVAAYLLLRNEKKLELLTTAVVELTHAVKSLSEKAEK